MTALISICYNVASKSKAIKDYCKNANIQAVDKQFLGNLWNGATRLKVSLEKPFTKWASEKLSIERLISKRGRQTPGSIIQTISLKQKKNLLINSWGN